jgi:hypothetical protein
MFRAIKEVALTVAGVAVATADEVVGFVKQEAEWVGGIRDDVRDRLDEREESTQDIIFTADEEVADE